MSVGDLPARYESVRLLGQGGGGEVWEVRDRVTNRLLALKLLAANSSEAELHALVREASALGGLEHLGVPQLVAFGSIGPLERRYLVREVVQGTSFASLMATGSGEWVLPLLCASEQLATIHRAGIFHGDIKPANIVVRADGSATLVDFGCASEWVEKGATAKGLTPKYAAPELLDSFVLTARAEVFALGKVLGEVLNHRGTELDPAKKKAFQALADRSTTRDPNARPPSVEEFASALRHAAGLSPTPLSTAIAWPMAGLDAMFDAMRDAFANVDAGGALSIIGPSGSGRTTLLRRLAWTLGVEGENASLIEAKHVTDPDAISDALGKGSKGILLVDDWALLPLSAKELVAKEVRKGARLAAAGTVELPGIRTIATFAVPTLTPSDAQDILKRAIPSVSPAVSMALIKRSALRPGSLRKLVETVAHKPLVSEADVAQAVDSSPMDSPVSSDPMTNVEEFLDRGRISDAAMILASIPASEDSIVRRAIAEARIALGRGDAKRAIEVLHDVHAEDESRRRMLLLIRSRAHLRAGEYPLVFPLINELLHERGDGIAAEGLAVRGLAKLFTDKEKEGKADLDDALRLALSLRDPRVEAIVHGSMAIGHQRTGNAQMARESYASSLAAAEVAGDAVTMAIGRYNLGSLARAEGHLAEALAHLEPAVDLGKRAGTTLVVQTALLQLASLDIYLGRYERSQASLGSLVETEEDLSAGDRALLHGLLGELSARTGKVDEASSHFEESSRLWLLQDRKLDAAEAQLERLLVRARASISPIALKKDFSATTKLVQGEFGEHAPLAALVRGVVAGAEKKESEANAAFELAHDLATKLGRREWAWLALEARGQLALDQGNVALGRKYSNQALEMLEETAANLPPQLREVFWNDPRRRALRQSNVTAQSVSVHRAPPAEDRLARILELTRELATEHDLDRLLLRITDHAVSLLGAERGFVVLTNDRGELETFTARNRKGDDPYAEFSHSVAERVVASGEPVIATSAQHDERLAQAVSVHQLMIQSVACVPIRGAAPSGRTIGALYVETRLRPGGRFTSELPTLIAFADQAAIAIENARLLDENKLHAQKLTQTNLELSKARDRLAELLDHTSDRLEKTRRSLKQARADLKVHFGYAGLVGTSAPMRKLYDTIERVKGTDVPVLIVGESGTGKELVAKAIHSTGTRGKKAFLGINCGALPENLLESELFGHERGAFTGADRERKGLFRDADGGTLLLDEIGEMPLKMQVGLLRVLQEGSVRSIGGSKEEKVDTRVIAATHRDLSIMVKEGTFREDLYYRLHVIELRVPPLRARKEDVLPLVDHFLTIFAARYRRDRKSVDRSAIRRLTSFDWPGNVRQLEHVLLNAWLMSEGDEIVAEDFGLPTDPRPLPADSVAPSPQPTTDDDYRTTERERILAALATSNWNRVQAAKLLGLPRRTFYRRLKEFDIL